MNYSLLETFYYFLELTYCHAVSKSYDVLTKTCDFTVRKMEWKGNVLFAWFCTDCTKLYI